MLQKKMLKKTNFMTIGFQIALWKICAKYRPFQIVSFMQEARISYTKTSQTNQELSTIIFPFAVY